MKNSLYKKFDLERLEKRDPSEGEYRSEFQVDRDRVIHSSEFRRLQGKTQVFLPGEYDFYRTRLTHSMEVSQIGRSIVNYLNMNEEYFNDSYYIDADLVEAACLAHDLGHPPFGHAGERTLNMCMEQFGGFEGNAQTLRLLGETFYKANDSRTGMNPTRAFLDSILKYKVLYGEYPEKPENHFLYEYQGERYLDFVFPNDIKRCVPLINDRNAFRSIECQIMDWADDTAYALNDIVDSINGGFISIETLNKFKKKYKEKLDETDEANIDEMISWIKKGKYKKVFGRQIGDFIKGCSISLRETCMDSLTDRYKYRLDIDEKILKRVKLYKKISSVLVFDSPQLHQMEYKGKHLITGIFKTLTDVYFDEKSGINILPEFSGDIIRKEPDKQKKARLICDYVAGMTDSYAMKTYRRLFDPEYSSLSDLI